MIISLINFVVGVVLLVIIPFVLLKRKPLERYHLYFTAIITIAGLQRILYVLDDFEVLQMVDNPFKKNLTFVYFMPVIYYLYLKNLLQENTSKKNDFILFTVAFIMSTLGFIFDLNRFSNQILFFIYSTTYLFLVIQLFYWFIQPKEKIRKELTTKPMKHWVIMIFSITVLFYICANYSANFDFTLEKMDIMSHFYEYTLVLWLIIILYIFSNPIVLYGKSYLLKAINNPPSEPLSIWRSSKKNTVKSNDLKVEKVVTPKLENILHSITIYEKKMLTNFTETPTLKGLSIYLGIPQSHLKYIFKYYNNYSFKEYQNVLKIKYAIQLIESNYLNKHTVDTLGKTCLFESRITFHNNFKKYTNESVSDYLLKLS